jgi:hypothetical protein
MKWLIKKIKQWWKKHICDEVPEELETMVEKTYLR